MSESTATLSRAVGFRVVSETIPLASSRAIDFVDVTDEIRTIVASSGVRDGVVVVFSAHTTAGVAINEAEPLLLDDMRERLDRFAPRSESYGHDDLTRRTVNVEPNERENGHAHCQRLMVGASESIPLLGGRLQMGRWQRVFFVELDGPRPRELTIQILGM